ncbi:hypothetical protein BD310DRAFT_408599 [Dichomitus squalens]|uniref:Uncharacterized protein n=1 Tax=Dichomitus squalens TaxID=114155 RepID=A0A4Q9PXP3_9APHY|nr:hypothetical protein BD310DRAFT_408599 [Dichomitus squalens]
MALTIGGGVLLIPFACFTLYQTAVTTQSYPSAVLRVVGCMPCIDDQQALPAYTCTMLAETGIIGLMLIKRYLDSDRGITSTQGLCQTMYRDGFLFFVIILVGSTINLLVLLAAPRELAPFAQLPLRALHSALCTRVVLNLRKAAARMSDMSLDDFTRQTTLQFDHADTSGDAEDPLSYELGEVGYLD